VSRFVEDVVARAGLLPLLDARRAGDLDTVRASMPSWQDADLLVLGAIADLVRADDIGDEVRIYEHGSADVQWVKTSGTDLELLREVAIQRIASGGGTRIGVDWGHYGLEIAQVALGFGVSDLSGPMTNKRGLPILEDETKKVKGEGMTSVRELVRREIGFLLSVAGRTAVFASERVKRADAADSSMEVAGA
jgi:2-iminoacetate synthase ThiH